MGIKIKDFREATGMYEKHVDGMLFQVREKCTGRIYALKDNSAPELIKPYGFLHDRGSKLPLFYNSTTGEFVVGDSNGFRKF